MTALKRAPMESLRFKARVRALPADGEANAAVTRLLAGALDVSRSAVSLVSGAQGRTKLFRIEGDSAALASRLEAIAAGRAAT